MRSNSRATLQAVALMLAALPLFGLGSFAQEASEDSSPSSPEPAASSRMDDETRNRMEQSQMSVSDLMRAGIIPSAASDSSRDSRDREDRDSANTKIMTPEEMQREIEASRGDRLLAPSEASPERNQHLPPDFQGQASSGAAQQRRDYQGSAFTAPYQSPLPGAQSIPPQSRQQPPYQSSQWQQGSTPAASSAASPAPNLAPPPTTMPGLSSGNAAPSVTSAAANSAPTAETPEKPASDGY